MRKTFPKVRHSFRPVGRLSYLLLPILLLLASCQGTKKLNHRNGRYYSAQEIARMKAAERRGRPVAGAVSKTKIKSSSRMSSGGRKIVAHGPKRTSSPASVDRQLGTVIEAARSYRGTPYKFGGTTRLGLDCSGLLNVSFGAAGIQIPRSSNEQAAWGDPIRPQDLQAGDLVFFGGSPGSGSITHVGLVTEVSEEGVQFIHSSTSLGVVENALESDYYLSRFIKAVRPKL
ncbi:NlpC/P60 family protein [Hymenobacter oligotrophus]|uniref:NlpC/P60 family protein n=2 Tax=Hymenobacter oligotrophus TaxID=2319843 RepID=A0A3B7RD67_9BACT|nr:NlpC/P60 family protein [Hymenobacter oligotrophus]